MTALEITCRDPIVARDGRPFGAGQGNRMRSLGWPFPSMVAGSLRSALGKLVNRDFKETAQDLLQVEVAGVFPMTDKQMYLPAPHDCVVHRERGPLRAVPADEGGGCDWPVADLRPVGLTKEQAADDFKPEDPPAWWPMQHYAAWISGQTIAFNDRFLRLPEIETRTHVQMDFDSGAAEEGRLFTSAALPLTHLRRHNAPPTAAHSSRFAAIDLAVRVRADGWCNEALAKFDMLHPLGGERRLAHWRATDGTSVWNCPRQVREALATGTRVRMTLTTPAIFREGWKPGWLNDDLTGVPPDANVTLRLVGVSIQRWRAVSGWSLAEPRGPKAIRRLVPSGGVYFFEVVNGGNASGLADRWLESVCDDEQDRRNGFGIAAWGVW